MSNKLFNLVYTLIGQDRQLLMQFDKENFKPLTIAVYDKLIYWIDKKQKDSQVEYLKWRHIQKELNVIYSSKWEYDGSRDLHVVQTDRLKGIVSDFFLNFLLLHS